MDCGGSIKANAQTSELVQPTDGAFHHPTCDAQAAAMHARTLADDRLDVADPQAHAIGVGAIARITLHGIGPEAWRPRNSAHRWNRIHQRQQLGHIIHIRGRDDRGQGNALAVNDEMVFGARFSAVGGIGARQFAPPTARTLELSTTARDQSSLSAARR